MDETGKILPRRRLVGQRCATQNAIRGFLSSLGLRFAKCSAKLGQRVEAELAAIIDLFSGLGFQISASADPTTDAEFKSKSNFIRLSFSDKGRRMRREIEKQIKEDNIGIAVIYSANSDTSNLTGDIDITLPQYKPAQLAR